MTIVAPLILPRPKKTPSRLSVAVDPFVEPWIKPKTLAKVGVAAAALRWALSKDLVAFLASYNAALATRPFQTKAIGTGVTYFGRADGQVAATPRPRRRHSVETSRGDQTGGRAERSPSRTTRRLGRTGRGDAAAT